MPGIFAASFAECRFLLAGSSSEHGFSFLLTLLLEADCHALRFIGTGNLKFFEPFLVSSLAIPPNALVGYAALVMDQDARDSRWDIVGERDG